MGDPATLEQWFTRRRRACLRKWRWLVVLAIVSTFLALVSVSGVFLDLHMIYIAREHLLWRYLNYLWLVDHLSYLILPSTAAAAFCGVALATLVSLAQVPPAEVQLPFRKQELAHRLRARLRANSWLWIGCTLLSVQTVTLLWAVDTATVISVRLSLRGQGIYSDPWWEVSIALVVLCLGLLLLYGQTYAIVRLRRSRAPRALNAIPVLCFVGLAYLAGVTGSSLSYVYTFGSPLDWAILLASGLIVAPLLLVCPLLDRMTLAECRRLFEEAR